MTGQGTTSEEPVPEAEPAEQPPEPFSQEAFEAWLQTRLVVRGAPAGKPKGKKAATAPGAARRKRQQRSG